MNKALFKLTKPVENLNLTVKQAKFLKLFLKLGNGSEAAMRVYNCKDRASAGAIAGENLQKLKNPIKLLMETRGLDLGQLLSSLDEGLKSTKIKTSMTEPDKEVPDYPTRHKYMSSMAKWLGVEESAPTAPTAGTVNQQYNFFAINEEDREAFNQKFRRFLKKFYQ